MRFIIRTILIVTIGCTNSKVVNEQSAGDTAQVKNSIAKSTPPTTQINLTDTTSNGMSVKFIELTDKTYDSLQVYIRRKEIPVNAYEQFVEASDTCFTIRLANNQTDTLCNMDDGEYYEKFEIKGLWKPHDILLVNFQNWEESHDFMINLKTGEHYILTPFYEPSPTLNLILSYIDISSAPIYESVLLITRFDNGTITTLYQKPLGEVSITDAGWISNTECLLAAEVIDFDTNEVKVKKKFMVKVE